MKFGAQSWIISDLSDVTPENIGRIAALDFHGMTVHLSVPAREISEAAVENTPRVIAGQGLEFLQVWGPYPCIISPDETVRQAGVAAARDVVELTARMGVPAAGVRPTSLNPNGDWWPHRDNHSVETEDRFRRSLDEILETADAVGVDIVLETHVTTVLDSPRRIKRIVEAAGSRRLKVNVDPVNFVRDLETAFNPGPMIEELFQVLGPHAASVHVKDYCLEDRFVVHISETVPGTGLMDLDTVLRWTQELGPDMYAIIEHLPVDKVPLAKANLTRKAQALGIPLG